MQSVPITTNVVSSNPVVKFVSDLQLVGVFLQVLRFPPPIKLTATFSLKILLKVALNTITTIILNPNPRQVGISRYVHFAIYIFCIINQSINTCNMTKKGTNWYSRGDKSFSFSLTYLILCITVPLLNTCINMFGFVIS